MAVDTKTISGRRLLRFESIDQVLADVDTLAAAQQRGTLRTLGNWTAGQNFGHLASWIDYSYDGVPFQVPLIARVIMRPFKNAFLRKPMRPGSRIPKLPGGTAGIAELPFDQGVANLRNNLTRLKSEPPTRPHAVFGTMTHDEWIAQHLRHAELHLSFLHGT